LLRKIGDSWQFESEAILEDFFRSNLQEILGLNVLSQQHYINGQICDLIAVASCGEISIIELKNCEDRYIVQQLTRYFDVVLQEQPFQEVVDYSKPIKLIAITPGFHRDNWTDRKYNQLNIDFLEYQVVQRQGKFIFILKDQDTNSAWEAIIPYQKPQVANEIPAPPRGLINILAKSPDEDRQGVMAFREIMLRYDNRMQEIPLGSSIVYGKGKSKLCAELKYDSMRARIALLLWLPYKATPYQKKERITRLRLWTDWGTVSALAHTPKLLGRTISIEEWQSGEFQPIKKLLPTETLRLDIYYNRPGEKEKYIRCQGQNYNNAHHSSGLAMTFEMYKKLANRPYLSNEFSTIITLALDQWKRRL
jgi:RecB family endonuclease NucS